MSFFRVNEKCNGCLACVENCPAGALRFQDQENRRTLLHNMSKCARCGNCWRICPSGAILFQYILEGQWEEVTTLSLARCEICGEPVFTSAFSASLAERLEREVSPRCPTHKESIKDLSLVYFPELGKANKKVSE